MDQNEKNAQIALLEQLRDEVLTAKRLDGARVLDASDMRHWLDEKLNTLRASALN